MKISGSMFLFKCKIILILFCLNFSYGKVYSHQNDSVFQFKNTIYTDFLNKGTYYSINFDRIFHQSKKNNLSYRLGFSILDNAISFPIGINLFTGKKDSHIEFSLTVTPYVDHYKNILRDIDSSDKYIYIVPGIGYRYQKPNGRFFFKLAFSPMLFLDPPSDNFWKMDPKLYFAANMGIGFSF